MKTLDKMRALLKTRYEPGRYEEGDIWQKMADGSCELPLPCMDVELCLMDHDPNYKQVYMLFSTGDSDYFPGIWLGNDDIELLDSMPIYVFDESTEDTPNSPVGNFRYYIETLVDAFLEQYDEDDEYTKTAHLIKEQLTHFSSEMIDKGVYPIQNND